MHKNHEKILAEYRQKYVNAEKNLYVEADNIQSDYRFFRELIRRFRKASPDLFSFDLRISCPGLIWDFFWRAIDPANVPLVDQRPDTLENVLAVFHIMLTLVNLAAQNDESAIVDLGGFQDTLEFYTGLTIDQCLVAFNGCSHSIESIREKLNRPAPPAKGE